MNYQDILTLAKAGFNAQQIRALMSINTQQPASIPANNEPAVVNQLNQNYRNPMQDELDSLKQQVSGVTQLLQLSNLANVNQQKQETTDDILAAIIAPPFLDHNK